MAGGATQNACAIGADLARSTFVFAFAAVVDIGVEVATDSRTVGQSGLAGDHTRRVGAYLTGGAFFAAGTTIIEVSFGIDTNA